MKKSIILASAVLAFAACTAELEKDLQQPQIQEGIVFEGGFNQDTKVAFDQETGGVYPLVWSKGDAIGIFSYDMTSTANVNVRADLVRSCDGQANGIFVPEEQIIPAEEEGGEDSVLGLEYPQDGKENFFVYYPYNTKTDIDVEDGLIHGKIAAIQPQDKLGDKKLGQNGFSCAMVSVSAEAKKVNFKLNHSMAYLRFVVSSSDYAAYKLSGVQLFDNKGTAAFGGEFTVDPVTGKATAVAGKGESSVKVYVVNNDFNGSADSEVYLTILPGDYSAADCAVAVSFVKEDGTTVTIPTTIPNIGNVPAGSMTTINVKANKADNKYAWYEPEEARDLINLWAYGEQNSYFIESKYAGEGNTSITIDVKARGDFSKVKEPKYYGWMLPAESRALCQLTDGTKAYESIPTHAIGSDYTVTIECLETPTQETANWYKNRGHFSVLAIYDEDYNVLWSFNFFKYQTDDPIKEIAYPSTNIVLLDRILGANSPQFAEEKCGGNPDVGVAYFQWGRPNPFMWSNSGASHYTQAYVSGTNDIAYAISNPNIILASQKDDAAGWNADGKWWVGDIKADLWGAPKGGKELNKNLVGHKTVFDPCPKGWRVIDDNVVLTVNANGSLWEIAGVNSSQDASRVSDLNPFKSNNTAVVAYPLGNDKYDYWYYCGAHWGSNNNWGNRISSNNRHGFCYYTNSCDPESRRVGVLQGVYFSSGWGTATDNKLCDAYPVRCQKDENGK